MKPSKHKIASVLFVFSLLLIGGLAACQSGGDAVETAPDTSEDAAAEVNTAAETETEADTEPASEDTTEMETEADADEIAEEEMAEEEMADEEIADEEMADDEAMEMGLQTFQIVSEESEARFFIDEELRGSPKTVVGTTSQVDGEIHLDPANPEDTKISPIQINARDFTTDSGQRNGAIRRFVLQSENDDFQFITFTPTAVEGLPDSVTVGDVIEFQVTGDLTIRDQVRPETFDVTVTAVAENEINGLGATTIRYADYGMFIPDVPFVANVADEVRLEIEFVAVNDLAEASSSAETATEAEAMSVAMPAKLNLNEATQDEFLTVPDVGDRMVREFFEYRPYISIQQFRQEIGKYVDEAQVAAYEQYVYVPVDPNAADEATLQQLPDVNADISAELVAGRPYEANEAFLEKLAEYVSAEAVAAAQGYLVP